MRTVEVKLYTFDELDDKAKERAMQWYREASNDDEWWSYDDFIECATRLGIEIKYRTETTTSGRTFSRPCIWFSGFWSQGDGACFEGSWSYKPDAVAAITEYAPQDTVLHGIAQRLHDIQSAHPLPLSAKVEHSGHYYHAGCTAIEIMDDGEGDLTDVAKAVASELRAFMNWMYRQLEDQWEDINSDESVSENIRINEYEFYSDGRRAREA